MKATQGRFGTPKAYHVKDWVGNTVKDQVEIAEIMEKFPLSGERSTLGICWRVADSVQQ